MPTPIKRAVVFYLLKQIFFQRHRFSLIWEREKQETPLMPDLKPAVSRLSFAAGMAMGKE